jgi:hypothetical protein
MLYNCGDPRRSLRRSAETPLRSSHPPGGRWYCYTGGGSLGFRPTPMRLVPEGHLLCEPLNYVNSFQKVADLLGF